MSARGPLFSSVFIAGTDTGIGKTFASCALLHALRAEGLRASGMKPIASGCVRTREGLRSEDALALIEASDPRPDYATCNPYAFEPAIAPHLAADDAGARVDPAVIASAFARLAAHADAVVVEGVGGWMVPLSHMLDASAIPRALGLPVILAVGLRLGCINHARLSARAITGDGCRLLGWIGNAIDPDMARRADNLATLRDLLPAPCLGVLEHGVDPATAARAGMLNAAVAALQSDAG